MTAASRSLTRSMQPIIEAVGFDAAVTLVARFGGSRILLAREPGERDNLSLLIGLSAARSLSQALGPGLLEIPRCVSWVIARRDEEIAARHLGGETHAELAIRFNLTERHIRNVLAEQRRAVLRESS